MTDLFDQRVRARFADVELDESHLHDYQDDLAIPFMIENPFSALFIDMGLGKSISSLTVIAWLIQELFCELQGDKILVIGPMRVATQTWPDEIRKWRHTAWLNHCLIYVDDDDPQVKLAGRRAAGEARLNGMSAAEARKVQGAAETAEKERQRKVRARAKQTIHIIPSNWVEWLVEFHGRNWPYRTVFIDESSGFKDHNSGRFKALAKVRREEGLITRLHELTATPAAETYEHLFAQIYLMDKGERFGKGITKYRDKYFNYNKYSRKYKLREGAEEEILAKISDICLVMKAEDYLDIEKPTIVERPVRLSEREMALYTQMQDDLIVTLPNGVEIEAETAAALSSRLLQMASGFLYETFLLEDENTEDFKKVKRTHPIHNHKIEMMKEIVEEAQGATILVGYHFKSSLDRLKKAFPQAVVMDREGKCVKAWNKGKIPMLLMHPQSGGHGLNLQDGGHHIVFFDLPWSLELYLQFIGRLARQGQKHPVVVQLLTAIGTLDQTVCQSLSTKEDAQEKLFRILKRLIRAKRKQ